MGCAKMTKAEKIKILKARPSKFGSKASKLKSCVKKVKAKGKVKSPYGICRKAVMGKSQTR